MGAPDRWSRARRYRGNAAVEFALVLPLLMLLLLGMLDWGHYFYVAQVVTNAAREGARAGTLAIDVGDATADAANAVTTYLTNAGLEPAKLVTSSVNVTAEAATVDLAYPAGSLTGFLQVVVPDNAVAHVVMRR